jgi:hypothetical protein
MTWKSLFSWFPWTQPADQCDLNDNPPVQIPEAFRIPLTYRTTLHEVDGVKAVGITPTGFKDPGPAKGLVRDLKRKR